MTAAEKNITLLESELRYIARIISNLQTSDFEAVDEIHRAIESAKRAAHELKLDAQPATEEIPEGVQYPAAA